MLHELENNYKKQLKEKEFNKFYWISTLILLVLTSISQNFFINKYYLIYIILGILVIIYFILDYQKTLKDIKKSNTLIVYVNQSRTNRINSLISNMKKYSIKTRNDIKLTINYYIRLYKNIYHIRIITRKILCLLGPILVVKSIISNIIFSKEKLHSTISEDLTYIYFNFNKYRNQLSK